MSGGGTMFFRMLNCTGCNAFRIAFIALSMGLSGQLFAEEGPAPGLNAAKTPEVSSGFAFKTIDPSSVKIPAVFSLPAPRSAADLKTIQDHVTQLVPTLRAATVNLTLDTRRGGGGSQGSGVIVSSDGIILTAAHVGGRPGRPVSIVTNDGKLYQGVTLGRNVTMDASLVRIESDRRDWPAVPVAVTPYKAGDWCLVLGHPGGYQEDRGIVLRLGRVVYCNKWLIQTDCELIGGDSGGPLFNMSGEVIGINTRIGEDTNFNIHVPIEVYTQDWNRLVAGEDFRTHSGAYLGLAGSKAPSGEGLVVDRVTSGDAAEREGIEVGDILLTFQGEKIVDLPQLTELVGRQFPGQAVKITLLRNGETKTVILRLGTRWEED